MKKVSEVQKPSNWIDRLKIKRGVEAQEHQEYIIKFGFQRYLQNKLWRAGKHGCVSDQGEYFSFSYRYDIGPFFPIFHIFNNGTYHYGYSTRDMLAMIERDKVYLNTFS